MRLLLAFLLSLLLHAWLLFWLLPTASQQGGESIVSVTPSEPAPNLIMPIATANLPGNHSDQHCVTNLHSWLLANTNRSPAVAPPAEIIGNIHCAVVFQRLPRQPRTQSLTQATLPILPVAPPPQPSTQPSQSMPQLVNTRRDLQKARFLAEIQTTKANTCQAIYDTWIADNQLPSLSPTKIPEQLTELGCSALVDLAQAHNQALIKAQQRILDDEARLLAEQQAEAAAQEAAAEAARLAEERRRRQQAAHEAQQAKALAFIAEQKAPTPASATEPDADAKPAPSATEETQPPPAPAPQSAQPEKPRPPVSSANPDPDAGKSDQQLIAEAIARQAAANQSGNSGDSSAQSLGAGAGSGNSQSSGNGNGNGAGTGQGQNTAPGNSNASVGKASSSDRPVQLISSAKPRYPAADKQRGHEGTTTLRAQISDTGKIGSISIVKSSGFPGLDQAAQATLQRYRFAPAIVGGQPATGVVQVNIVFQLR